MLAREDYLKQITYALTELRTYTELCGGQHLFDVNTVAEHFFEKFLNGLYDCDLRNLNTTDLNAPAIDLGDPCRRLAYQITSDGSAKKVQHTIDRFTAHKLGDRFDPPIVLVIGRRQKTYGNLKTGELPGFDPDKHVVDINGLLGIANGLPTERLEAACAVIDLEIKRRTHFSSKVEKLVGPVGYDNRAARTGNISSSLHQRLREALVDCDEFSSQGQLRAFFALTELRVWSGSIPESDHTNGRVDQTIAYLIGRHLEDGRNGLLLLTHNLKNRYRDERRTTLNQLHSELATELNVPLSQ